MRIELSMPMSVEEIGKATDGEIRTAKERIITHITTDSREIKPNDLFVAIKGKHFDGENYTDEARKRGALCISNKQENSAIKVADTGAALMNLASYYIKKLPYIKYRIGVSGSVGKTTTKEFIKVLLGERYITHASSGNLNNEIGMPLTVLSAPRDCEVIICEMGMNHRGEISRMSKAFCPDVGVITNIGTAHIGNLGSRENIAKAKLELQDGIRGGALIIPESEPLLRGAKRPLTFGLNDDKADYNLKTEIDGHIVFYNRNSRTTIEKFAFSDEHLLFCLSAALSVCNVCKLQADELNRGVFKISKENIRQKIIRRKNIHFCQDCYNASEESIYAVLKSISALQGYSAKSAVLGDILELGAHSKEIHLRIGRNICGYNIERLYLIGKESAFIRDGALECGFPSERIFYNPNSLHLDVTAEDIKRNSQAGEIILLKASRAIKLERLLDLIE